MAETWRNWSRELVAHPRLRVRAASVDDVRAAVARAADLGCALRTTGSGHSFSPLCVTDGVLLTLDGLTGLRDVDRARGEATIWAGTPLSELGDLLRAQGLAQENLGDVDVQTLAGATATATHGTGLGFGSLADQVTALELVTPDGELRRLDAADGDRFQAARASLGVLGVVTAITLRVVPAFTLRSVERLVALEQVYADLPGVLEREERWELFAFPHAGRAVTHSMTRVDEAPSPAHPLVRHARDELLANDVFGALQRLGRRRPRLVPAINRFVTAIGAGPVQVDASHRVLANSRRVRFTEMELGIPVQHAAEGLRRALAAAEACDAPVSFPVQLRSSAADEALIAPAHGRDTAFIAVHAFEGTPWQRYFRAVAAALADLDARPHWGKRSFLTAEDLPAVHPGWERFAAVREELDPEGRMLSAELAALLGARAVA